MAPFLALYELSATGTAVTGTPPTVTTQNITIAANAHPASPAPLVSVAELTPTSAFGGDIVRIKAGPGGDFGKGIYAISRGAGDNAAIGAINRPGVIYRVDPATGKASVFFDLNTVISQLEPGGNASNSLGNSTGLVNWYDIAFDPEGYFDGRPSMFVASVDRQDPFKNAIYRIAPDGTFMGFFTAELNGLSAQKFTSAPSAIAVPPVQQQQFLRGLFAGTGVPDTTGTFETLFFDANQFVPGTTITDANLPAGVDPTLLVLGPQVAITSANNDYPSPVYAAFTDFGTPGVPPLIPPSPGLSGIQGLGGELLINEGVFPPLNPPSTLIDVYPFIDTTERRFQDMAFDQYGYFSYGFPSTIVTSGTQTTATGGVTTVIEGQASFNTGEFPVYAGSLFVSDLASGLAVAIPTPQAPAGTPTNLIPVEGAVPGGAGTISVIANPTNPAGPPTIINTTPNDFSGRIMRITPDGVMTPFAEGFHTNGSLDSSSFLNSELSITFSADGTTMYASDDDAIWQFKSVASLANSTSGSLMGLNDLRTFGVPYEGQDSAVAVVDTGVDALTPNFQGRVSPGINVLTNGPGNDDLEAGQLQSPGSNGTIISNGGIQGGVGSVVGSAPNTAGTLPIGGNGQNNNGGGGNNNNTADPNGHGTLLAGVIAQFVPQATLTPVDIFSPFLGTGSAGTGTGGTGGGGNGGGGGILGVQGGSAFTTNDAVYNGFNYLSTHPFVTDPVRPGQQDRLIAANFGFGTVDTFTSEGEAYRKFPQVVVAFKNQLKKLRDLGVAPIAAAGQYGEPVGQFFTPAPGFGSGVLSNGTGITGDVNGMPLPAVLNEVVSVTGVYPFPFTATASTPPIDPTTGVVTRPMAPVLVSQFLSIGGTTTGGGTGGTGTGVNTISSLTAGDGSVFANKVLASDNRNATTDFAAPEIDIPTFRRRFVGDGFAHNVFNEGGTSLSSAIVTGSFATVASAVDYWVNMNRTGATADGYLTGPVGVDSLNFGPHAFEDLSAFANPDGINAILQWTAVPATDQNIGGDQTTAPQLIGSSHFRQYSRVDIGNAIAAIEGSIAINWLLQHNIFPMIDSDHNGLITAQEVQNFVDNAATIGLPEAGAMARFLGGTARSAGNGFTVFGEQPDQPDALQRRFNFFDWSGDGQLNGVISIDQFKMLSQTLLPTPDAYVIVDRQRASNNAYLVDAGAMRNYRDLQHLQPSFEWVPKRAMLRFRNVSPALFHVNRGLAPTLQAPVYTLFHPPAASNAPRVPARGNRGNALGGNQGGQQTPTPTPTPTPPTNNGGSTSTGQNQSSSTGSNSSSSSNTNTSTNQANQNAILAAIQALVNAGASSSATPGSPQPAGSLGASTGHASTPTVTAPSVPTLGNPAPAGTVGTPAATPTTVLGTPTPAKPATTTATNPAATTTSTTTPTTPGTTTSAPVPLPPTTASAPSVSPATPPPPVSTPNNQAQIVVSGAQLTPQELRTLRQARRAGTYHVPNPNKGPQHNNSILDGLLGSLGWKKKN